MNARQIPADALRFDAGRITFDRAALAAKGKGETRVPFSMMARTGQPIAHWYWGLVVHDMTGLRSSKPTVPIDYQHDPKEVIGFADKLTPSNAGLHAAGELLVFREDDRAAEVIFKARSGVPYQASIFFDQNSATVEDVPAGSQAKVNGYSLAGPATIFRTWELRGIAVCPYGMDGKTETKLTLAGDARVRLLTPEESARRAKRDALALIYGSGVATFATGMNLPGAPKR